jgi:hypothetical protein
MSPEAGVQEIRRVLFQLGYDMPAIYDLDPEGDEIILELHPLDMKDDEEIEKLNLYVIYYLTDDDVYEFFAEVVDDDILDEIIADGEDEEEEQ